MPLRVSSVFVSKFDQAVYWMDRAKRAGVPRKMQIEGFLEELKGDLMEIVGPKVHWTNKESQLELLRDEILQKIGHLSFGLENPRRADAVGWAIQAVRLEHNADWAIDWIRAGYPEPPEWIKKVGNSP